MNQKFILKKKNAIIFPTPSDYNKYTLLLINDNNGEYTFTQGEKLDYDRFEDSIFKKYAIDESSYPYAYAFIEKGKKIDDFYDFKIIHSKKDKNDKVSYTKGRLCANFHEKDTKYDSFMKLFMSRDFYDDLFNKYNIGKHICALVEIYFRYNDINNVDNKKWFMSMNHVLINKK